MKILFLVVLFWLGGGFAIHSLLPTWVLVLYGFVSLVYFAAWMVLRRGLLRAA